MISFSCMVMEHLVFGNNKRGLFRHYFCILSSPKCSIKNRYHYQITIGPRRSGHRAIARSLYSNLSFFQFAVDETVRLASFFFKLEYVVRTLGLPYAVPRDFGRSSRCEAHSWLMEKRGFSMNFILVQHVYEKRWVWVDFQKVCPQFVSWPTS